MKADVILSSTLSGIMDRLNYLGIPREQMVNVFQNKDGAYVAVFYH